MDKALVIQGGLLVRPAALERADLEISRGRITRIIEGGRKSRPTGEAIDARGLYVAPGFIDLQVNGGGGADFMEATAEEIEGIIRFHNAHGTTALLATTLAAPVAEVRAACERVRRAGLGSILGLHIEGSFVSPERKGAHDPRYFLSPSWENFRILAEGYEDFVKVVTLAPELEGALNLIEGLKAAGIVPALGHSNATYEEARAAVEKGIRLFTHFFNAMRGFHHREPGAVGAAFDSEVMVELIADGVHVHPAAVRLLLKAKGVDKICLVTDSISAAGLGDGQYSLVDQEVIVEGGVARLADGTLAGSTLTMERAVKNFMEFTGLSLPEAVRAATLNPARLLGLEQRKGSIAVGKDADLVIFDEAFNVHYTIIGGEIVYARADPEDRR